ncbi:HEPN domain-containing protein [Nocardiopsis sp. LOL_012]|uniref:HEPN domain-containing protein n=1 Tax=Nocardiopsis sp. LOL_012 TaxID=3345409 RepID=UPI003A87172B
MGTTTGADAPQAVRGKAHSTLLDSSVPDVSRLLEFHAKETGEGRGRRRPEIQVVSRSAVVLTCAYWEAFCEDLAAEALRHLADYAACGTDLPKELKKSLVKDLADDKDELAAWRLADEGWKKVLRDRADVLVSEDDRSLNTPKSKQVKEFFKKHVGVPDITKHWKWHKNSTSQTTQRLDDFVTLRGSIAHRGSPEGGVHKRDATNGLDLVQRLADKSAIAVSDFLEQHTGTRLLELALE